MSDQFAGRQKFQIFYSLLDFRLEVTLLVLDYVCGSLSPPLSDLS